MADILRMRVAWTGTPVPGGGVSTFYALPTTTVSAWQTAVKTFFSSCSNFIANGITWTIPANGDTIDDTTGHLTGAWTNGTDQTTTSGTSGSFAAGVGMLVRWKTGSIYHNRRIQGRTFLLPVASNLYEADGTILNSQITLAQNAANAYVATPNIFPVVWSRPGKKGPGSSFGINSAQAMDKVAVLRSRRH